MPTGTQPPLVYRSRPFLPRHAYVSLMYAAGVPLETIGDYVGHSSTYMTDRYRHLLPGSHDDARKRLDALLAGRV